MQDEHKQNCIMWKAWQNSRTVVCIWLVQKIVSWWCSVCKNSMVKLRPLTSNFFCCIFVISSTCIRCFVLWLISTLLVYATVTSNHRIYYLIRKLLCWSCVILAGKKMVRHHVTCVWPFKVNCVYSLESYHFRFD